MTNDDLLDSVDAMVFSGDSLHNREALEEFKYYLRRWTKEADSIEDCVKQQEGKKKMKKYDKVFIYRTSHLLGNSKNDNYGVFEDNGTEDGGELIAAFKYPEHADAFANSIANEVTE